MGQFYRGGFVCKDSLSISPYLDALLMQGQVACLGNIVIDVAKLLRYVTDDPVDPEVQTEMYSYNVKVHNVAMLFRYDNQHREYVRPGHSDEHHKHLFAPWSSNELPDSPLWIGADNWPTLSEVIREAQEWHGENAYLLDDPHAHIRDLQTILRL